MRKVFLPDVKSHTETGILDSFIRDNLPQADGDSVKVYLYILHNAYSGNTACTPEFVEKGTGVCTEKVVSSIKYWEGKGLLNIDNTDTGCGEHLLTPSATRLERGGGSRQKPPKIPPERKYTAGEYKKFSEDIDISALLCLVSSYVKHSLSTRDTDIVLYWHMELSLSDQVIMVLLDYCVTRGHFSLQYMNRIAVDWYINGVVTAEEAKKHGETQRRTYRMVMKEFGIRDRHLAQSEQEYLNKWAGEYGFKDDIIKEACVRTICATHQPNFKYADAILQKWFKRGVRTLADAAALDEEYQKGKNTDKAAGKNKNTPAKGKNSFNDFNQRQYDWDELEKFLLEASVGN